MIKQLKVYAQFIWSNQAYMLILYTQIHDFNFFNFDN